MEKIPTCETVLVCEKVTISETTNLLNLSNLSNVIVVTIGPEEVSQVGKGEKQMRLPVSLVLCWKSAQYDAVQEYEATVSIVDPVGKLLVNKLPAKLSIPPQTDKYFSLITMPEGFSITTPGVYTIIVQATDGTVLHEEPLNIKIQTGDGKDVVVA
jgi:hypothetical protein